MNILVLIGGACAIYNYFLGTPILECIRYIKNEGQDKYKTLKLMSLGTLALHLFNIFVFLAIIMFIISNTMSCQLNLHFDDYNEFMSEQSNNLLI